MEKTYKETISQNKEFAEEILIEKVSKMTVQILYVKGSIDKYDSTEEVIKDCLLIERRRPDLEKSK